MKVSAVFVMGAVSIACLSACLAGAWPARAQDTGPSPLAGTTWRLSELSGEPVVAAAGAKSPYLLLQAGGDRVQGFGGCNSFSGSYELKEGGRIRFFGVAATMMACPDMEIESQLFRVLETADNYALTDRGFSLHRARMAPLARFEAAPAP
jgi:heat shock protein HslJ